MGDDRSAASWLPSITCDFAEQFFRDALVYTARSARPREQTIQGIPFVLKRTQPEHVNACLRNCLAFKEADTAKLIDYANRLGAAFRQQSSRTNGAEADRDCWRADSSLACPLEGGAPAAGDEWRIFFPGSSRRG